MFSEIRDMSRHAGRQSDKKTSKQAHKERQTDRQTDIQRQTNKQTARDSLRLKSDLPTVLLSLLNPWWPPCAACCLHRGKCSPVLTKRSMAPKTKDAPSPFADLRAELRRISERVDKLEVSLNARIEDVSPTGPRRVIETMLDIERKTFENCMEVERKTSGILAKIETRTEEALESCTITIKEDVASLEERFRVATDEAKAKSTCMQQECSRLESRLSSTADKLIQLVEGKSRAKERKIDDLARKIDDLALLLDAHERRLGVVEAFSAWGRGPSPSTQEPTSEDVLITQAEDSEIRWRSSCRTLLRRSRSLSASIRVGSLSRSESAERIKSLMKDAQHVALGRREHFDPLG